MKRAALTAALLLACAPAGPAPRADLETRYQTLRYWDDQRRLLGSLGRDTTPDGISASAVADSLTAARQGFAEALADGTSGGATSEERRARATMVEAWRNGLAADDLAGTGRADSNALEVLTRQVYAAYGHAAGLIVVEGDSLNRLAILGRLARTEDRDRRRRLFLALEPVWRSVNGDNSESSPYRRLLQLRRQAWGDTASPIEQKAPAFGLSPVQLERWLTGALGQWRDAMPDTLLEPWDWYYYAGQASRRLSPRAPTVADIRRVNDAFYSSIGAPPDSLGIHYDLLPRPDKDPVAYTDFGSRNRRIGGRLVPGQPWIFTAYLEGGLDNLSELLHETGHGIHIAAIRTRPAWTDWPDNDTFTEALADLAALEIYEPRWQIRFLGDSVATAEGLRARYAGIVFDMAWALFELQIHRRPESDPNRLWSSITSEYLGIAPHPELSWWAMRGQLINGPGYLVNYALGAFITADLRARAASRGHGFGTAGPTLYPWLSAGLFRFGQERPSREVLERFLGRPLKPDALLADLRRMAGRRKP